MARPSPSLPRANEPIAPFHRAAGRDQPAHDCSPVARRRRLPLVAGLGAALGRLPHHPGHHALSRRQPRSHGLLRHRPARAAVRPDAGPEADDVEKLGRRLRHRPAVRPHPRARHRRAGSPGRHQRRHLAAAHRPAGAADLRQGQPGRHADHDPRAHLGHLEAHRGAEPGRHPACAKDLATARRRPRQPRRRQPTGGSHPLQPARPRRLRPQHRRSAHQHRQR